MKNVKRRDLLQTVAMASSTLALPGCAEGDLDHDLGVSVQGLVVHPRAYVTTHTLNPGGTLQWCASYGSSAGMARLRIMRVASMSSATSPQTDTPLVVNRNVSLSAATAPYNGDEVGYGWPITNEVLPTDIEPGLYAAQWSGDGVTWDGATVAYFVVRPVSGVGDILLCMPFSTTLAYAGAPWGQHVNLYDSFQWGRGRRVSMDRPWDQSDKPERTVRYPLQLYNFIRAMPGAPNVDLCTSFDLHENGSLLSGYKLFISAGHDEYWSKEMRDAVEAFVAAGGNAAFFSANTAWWQVRFSGRTMICHKSGVEDQFAGVDDARVTANSSACPTNRPENTLTGVSYRRGVAFPSTPLPFTIVATGHPYFADVAGTTFGSSALLSYETDAVEYGAGFVPTGRDGSPTNLEVLAYADMSADDGGSQKGQATMTRFTNNGVVFSAATTEWCDQLGDPKVAQITRNVIDALKTTSTNATWTLPARSNPGAAWETLDSAVGAGVALVGVVQGSLLAYGGNFRQRDPETPSVAWSSTSIPALAGLKSLASDLWGKFLYAGTSGGTVFRRSSRAGNAAAWGQAVAPPAGVASCLGLGALTEEIFGLFGGSGATLYRRTGPWPIGSWDRLGAPFPALKTITALDSKLFGVAFGSGNDDLVCRESSPIDLVWTKIGTMPTNTTLALGGYYGRLYALTGASTNATLRWRAAVADSAGMFKAPSLLLLNGASCVIGTLNGNGDFEKTGVGGAPDSYVSAVRANNGLVFFYHSNGSAAICRYNADGTRTTLKTWPFGSFGAWTSLAYVFTGDASGSNEKVIFYNSSSANNTIIGRFDTTTGDFIAEWSSAAFATGWTHIVSTNAGKLCFYNATNGTLAWGRVTTTGVFTGEGGIAGLPVGWQVVVPAGNRYLFFYNSSGARAGAAALAEIDTGFVATRNWAAQSFGSSFRIGASANGALLFYNAGTGAAVAGGFSGNAFFNLRAFPAGALGTGWTTLVPLPRLT